MSTSASYVPRLYDFLRRLSRNNNRPWFNAHKAEYLELHDLWLADIDRLIAAMAQWEPAMASQTARSAAYRIYRDTRFSLDKTPYKLNLSAAISPYGRKTHYAAYYIEMGVDGIGAGLYGGLWMPDAAQLRKLRQAIVDNIEEFEAIITDPALLRYFPRWEGEALKTIPKGWERDHPQAPLLRLKQYGRYCPCDEPFFADPSWPERAAERYALLKPLVDFLNYSLDEDTTLPDLL